MRNRKILALCVLAAAAVPLAGCSEVMTTTNAVADAAHSVSRMTSSTSRSADAAREDHSARRFVDMNINAIQAQAARGYGDDVRTLAMLLHDPHPRRFGHWMQRHYRALFVGLKRPADLLMRVRQLRAAGVA